MIRIIKYKPLNEGLIKVPKEWLDYCFDEIQFFLISHKIDYLMLNIKSCYEIIDLMYKEIDNNQLSVNEKMTSQLKANKIISTLNNHIKDKQKEIEEYKDLLLWIKNTYKFKVPNGGYDLYISDLSNTLSFRFNPNLYKSAIDSRYVKNLNLELKYIDINLDLIHIKSYNGQYTGNDFLNHDLIDLSSNHYNNNIYSVAASFKKGVIDMLNEYKATLEHELMHYIQRRILSYEQFYNNINWDEYQRSRQTDLEYYSNTELEFQPLIVSARGRFQAKYNELNNTNFADFINQDFFFQKIKHDKNKWQKAVKLFYGLLSNTYGK